MSFGSHLEELRKRLIYSLVLVAPIFITSLVFGESLVEFLIIPAQKELHAAGLPAMLIVTNPLETLSAWLKVATVITVVIGIPMILYQLWLFIAPGLYEHERHFAQLLMPMSVGLSAIGLAFLYYIMLPAMLAFLIHFGMSWGSPTVRTAPLPPGITALPTVPVLDADPIAPRPGEMWFNRDLHQFRMNVAPEGKPADTRGANFIRSAGIAAQYKVSEYIGMVFSASLAFVIGFQTPVVVLLLGWVGIINRPLLIKNRRYAIFFSGVAAAILAPSPDPLTMIGMAIPLYGLYELGVFLLRVLPAERVARGFWKRKPAQPDASSAGADGHSWDVAQGEHPDAYGPEHAPDASSSGGGLDNRGELPPPSGDDPPALPPPRREPPDAGDE